MGPGGPKGDGGPSGRNGPSGASRVTHVCGAPLHSAPLANGAGFPAGSSCQTTFLDGTGGHVPPHDACRVHGNLGPASVGRQGVNANWDAGMWLLIQYDGGSTYPACAGYTYAPKRSGHGGPVMFVSNAIRVLSQNLFHLATLFLLQRNRRRTVTGIRLGTMRTSVLLPHVTSPPTQQLCS